MTREFTSEDVASGIPGYVMPLSVQFSPDGEKLTYLFPDETGKRTLQCIDIAQSSSGSEGERYTPYKLLDPVITTAASASLSLAEQLRRERMRLFTSGVSSYEWTAQGETQWILVPLGNKLFLYREDKHTHSERESETESERERERVRLVYDGSLGAPIDAHLSPDGSAAAFVINNNLFLQQIPPTHTLSHRDTYTPPAPVQLTHEGQESKGLSYGLADYVAQEEMSRYRGFWWSPDSAQLLLCVCDESAVPQYEIAHQGKDSPAERETHRYPFAGARNAVVRLAVLSVAQYTLTQTSTEEDKRITQGVDTLSLAERDSVVEKEGEAENELRFLSLYDVRDPRFHCPHIHREGEREVYIARAGWWPDGSIMVQIQNREQNVLQLLRIDPQTHRRTVLLEETSRSFINLHDLLHPLSLSFRPHTLTQSMPTQPVPLPHNAGDFCFVWGSERSGFSQLYLYQYDSVNDCGVSLCEAYDALPLSTGGEWVVESIDAVDEQRGVIYFSGNYAAPTERHLCVASLTLAQTLAQTRFARLTQSAGWHICAVSASQCVFADTYCDLHTPVSLSLYEFSLSPPSHKNLIENETYPQTAISSPVANVRCLKTVLDTRTLDMRFVRDPSLCEALSLAAPTLHTIPSADDPHTHLVCAVYLPKGLSLDMYLRAHKERDAASPQSSTHTTLTYNSTQEDSTSLTQQEHITHTHTTQRAHLADSRPLPSFPAVCAVYGGPHVQCVRSHWALTADLRAQRLTQSGCVVVKCDNRGSARRGLAFESAIHRCVGRTELSDQRHCIEYFQRIGLIHAEVSDGDASERESVNETSVSAVSDVRESSVVCSPPAVTARKRSAGESSHSQREQSSGKSERASRVGVVGWSYGGYLSAMSLCTHGDLFCCAVVGAPVTSWDGYDTHYTERYMGLPQENVQGYEQSSVLSHVSEMRGRLLLIHGLIDENVHFRHTARLINALIAARKRYELVLFPCERHAPHKLGDRVYLEDILHEFLLENLRPTPFDANKFFADSVSVTAVSSVLQQTVVS